MIIIYIIIFQCVFSKQKLHIPGTCLPHNNYNKHKNGNYVLHCTIILQPNTSFINVGLFQYANIPTTLSKKWITFKINAFTKNKIAANIEFAIWIQKWNEVKNKEFVILTISASDLITAGNHVTQQQQQWPIFEKNPWLQVRKSSVIPLIHDRLEFGLEQRRWKDSRDLLDVLDFLNNTWSKSYWRANKFFTLDNCLLCFKPNSNQSRINGIIEDFLTWSWGIFSNVGHCCCRCVTWFPAVLMFQLLTDIMEASSFHSIEVYRPIINKTIHLNSFPHEPNEPEKEAFWKHCRKRRKYW